MNQHGNDVDSTRDQLVQFLLKKILEQGTQGIVLIPDEAEALSHINQSKYLEFDMFITIFENTMTYDYYDIRLVPVGVIEQIDALHEKEKVFMMIN